MSESNGIQADIDAFIDDVTKQVLNKQKEIVSTAMDSLFSLSPHYIGGSLGRSRYAQGEYDANHKVLIDGMPMTSKNAPTFSYEVSKSINEAEKGVLDLVTELGHTVSVTNFAPHAIEVETGFGWRVPGYAPYTITNDLIKGMAD
jgi:hypothetical protein